MNAENLVVLQEGIKAFTIDDTAFTYKPNTYYRAIPSDFGVVVDGVDFKLEYYNEVFETVQQRVLRHFEQLGIIVNGKVISRTAFGKLLDVHRYGRGQNSLKIGYAIKHPRELLYGFFPMFRGETKANVIKLAYINVLDIIEGNMDSILMNLVQYGNCGIPIGANSTTKLKVRDTTNEIPFEL